MTITSRKRKIQHTYADDDAARSIFQKHFESHFAPLPESVRPTPKTAAEAHESGETSDDDEEEWSGISDEEEEAVEVVDYASKPDLTSQTMRKREHRAFMV